MLRTNVRHVDRRHDQYWRRQRLQRRQHAAQRTLVGNGIHDLAMETLPGGWVLASGSGNEQSGAGPAKFVKKMLQDRLTAEIQHPLGHPHTRSRAASENGKRRLRRIKGYGGAICHETLSCACE